MPLHEVVVRTSYFNQECINRYNYVSTGTPAAVTSSFGLAFAMGYILTVGESLFDVGTLARAIQGAQVEAVEYVDILVKDVYDPVNFYTTAFPAGVNGEDTTTGVAMSPASAYGFRSARSRLDIRRGFKRYVGASEGTVQSGGQIATSFLTGGLGTIADRLGDTLTYDDEGNTLSYAPVIVKKFPYTTPSGRTAYRYATDADGGESAQLAQVAGADVWQPYTQIRTQVSRQYGRGR